MISASRVLSGLGSLEGGVECLARLKGLLLLLEHSVGNGLGSRSTPVPTHFNEAIVPEWEMKPSLFQQELERHGQGN